MDFGVRKSPAGGAPGASDLIKDGTTASFAKDVLEASRQVPVLVDFWAAWCGPCKQLTPVLEKVVRSYGGRVKLVKINTDEHPGIAGQMRVQSLPTVYAFRDGRPLDGFMGAQPEGQIRAFIDRLIGPEGESEVEQILEAANQALDAGDLQGAAEAFAAILQEDQGNAAALAGLAACYLKSGDMARAEQTIALVSPDKRNLPAVQAVIATIDLKRKAGPADNREELLAKIVVNPADYQSRYDLAITLAAHGDKANAVEHLLEIVRRDRMWNEEAARKQLVQFFEAWGPKDNFTIEGRKRLSSMLFK